MFIVVGGVPYRHSFINLTVYGFALTLEEASEIANRNYHVCGGLFTIIDTTTCSEVQWIDQSPETKKMKAQEQTNEIINNHICSTCGNDKCSTSEKSCWKCGNAIKV